MGTIRNTTNVSDMTRAIWRPEYRSRTTERDDDDAGRRQAVHEAPGQQRHGSCRQAAEQRREHVEREPAEQYRRRPKRSDIMPQNS